MNIITESNFYLTELIFLKRDTNIYFEYINLFEEKKSFTEKNFCKNHRCFFLKNIFFFQKVLLHLNNHSQVTLVLCVKLFVQYFVTIFWKVAKSSLQRKDHSMTKWRSDRPLSSTFRRLSYYFSKTLLFLE